MSDTNNPLVSIGIPTYNRANGNLKNVIIRALEQTYSNVEVIVSDNCSSDNTSELVQSIQDPRLRYIRHETNIGAINNFNHCLKEAKGEYFLLFHDDDMIDKDFVESCVSSLEPGQSVGIMFTGIRIIDGEDNILEEHRNQVAGLSSLDFILGYFSGKIPLFLPSTLYNTAGLREVGGFQSKKNRFPDLVATFKLVANYSRVDIADIKASFRRHTANLGSSVRIQDWADDSVYLLEVLYELFPNNREILKEKGNLFLCKNMYRRVSRRKKSIQRYIDYLRVYKAHNFCYSPIEFYYGDRIRRKFDSIKRILKLN